MTEKTETKKEKYKKKVAEIKANHKKRTAAVKAKIKGAVAKKSPNPNTVTQNKLELLITVVNRNKAEYYSDLLQSFEVNMQFQTLAQGTANEKMLGYLGLTDSDKVVIFSVIQEKKINDALNTLEEKFAAIRNGNGIAFTVPFSSVIGTLIYGFLSNNRMAVKENK